MKRLLLASLSLILLASCGSQTQVGTVDTSNAVAVESSSPEPLDGWSVSVGKPENKGRTFAVSEYSKQEAVDTWTVVPVTIKNTSGKRQAGTDVMGALYSFGLVDSKGKVYEPGSGSLVFGDDITTPFNANESRKTFFMFDTPQNIKPSHLITNSYDPAQGKTMKF